MSRVIIEVPATSANVGVGFDCLGFALNLHARFIFEPSPSLMIDGCEERFRGVNNLVWTSYLTACETLGFASQPLHITIDSPIPLAGGLGSSSTCVVAGIAAAQLLAGSSCDRSITLDLATRAEGHPDNVAPAVLGGLVSSFLEDGRMHSQRFEIADNLRFVAVAPPYEVRTADARKVLPRQVPLETAVWQMGRCVAMVHALETGDCDLIAAASHDRLHEPYRAQLIRDYAKLRGIALEAGACAYLISGSGSTMLAVCEWTCAQNVANALASYSDQLWVRSLSADMSGMQTTLV